VHKQPITTERLLHDPVMNKAEKGKDLACLPRADTLHVERVFMESQRLYFAMVRTLELWGGSGIWNADGIKHMR
jgi:hypothetical protein